MRSEMTMPVASATMHQYLVRGCHFLILLALVCSLAGTTTHADDPEPCDPCMVEEDPEMPPPEEEGNPEIIDFSAIQYPGQDNWLVSGQIVGILDPEDIDVTIGGVVSASALTDIYGFFEVVVYYPGSIDTATADADYNGTPLTQVVCSIGF